MHMGQTTRRGERLPAREPDGQRDRRTARKYAKARAYFATGLDDRFLDLRARLHVRVCVFERAWSVRAGAGLIVSRSHMRNEMRADGAPINIVVRCVLWHTGRGEWVVWYAC